MKKLFLILIFIFSFFSQNSFAQSSNVYLIENVEGKANANSAGEAKILATKNARRAAFSDLLSRLSLNVGLVSQITDEEIFEAVLSEQISDEKISPSDYSANFNILFSKSITEKVLGNQDIKKNEFSLNEDYLLIPIKVFPQNDFENNLSKFVLWGDENEWRKALENSAAKSGFSQFVIPDDDVSNVAMLNQDNIENIKFDDLEMMLSKYKSSEAIIMFFSYDKIENKVTILIENITKLQKKKYKLGFVNVDRLSYDDLKIKVCEKLIEYLINAKKNTHLEKNIIKIEIPISGLGNWLMIKDKIEKSNLVNQLNIESISKDYVTISINYINKKEGIIAAFGQINLFLEKKNDNIYSLIVE